MKKVTFTIIMLWVLSFTSLAYATPSDLSGEWELKVLNGGNVGTSTPITIQFVSDQATSDGLGLPDGLSLAMGFGGCNQYDTTYYVVGVGGIQFQSINAGPLSPDPVSVECDLSNMESAYFEALAATSEWSQDGQSLMMQDVGGTEVLQFSSVEQATTPLAVSLNMNDVVAGSGMMILVVVTFVIGLSTATVMKNELR